MDIIVGNQYPVKVRKILPVGAVVTVNDDPNDTYLIHISNLANTFVKDVAEFVSVGETHMATAIVGKKRPIELSLKDLDLKSSKDTTNEICTKFSHHPPKVPEFSASLPKSRSGGQETMTFDAPEFRRPSRRPQTKKSYGRNKTSSHRDYHDF